jgi:cytochrome c-type biogenesis protein
MGSKDIIKLIPPIIITIIIIIIIIIIGLNAEETKTSTSFLPINLIIAVSTQLSTIINQLGSFLPLGLAFLAGMSAAVNPCGFILLPTYLGLILNENNHGQDIQETNYFHLIQIALFVTLGFIIIFATIGFSISFGARSIIQELTSFITITIGVIFIFIGIISLNNDTKIYLNWPVVIAAKFGDPRNTKYPKFINYLLFGMSYAIASISCTLPIFLAVIGVSLTNNNLTDIAKQFVLYSLGMGFVISITTLVVASLENSILKHMTKFTKWFQYASSTIMILAGSYLIFYWTSSGILL